MTEPSMQRQAWRRGDPIVVFGDDWGRFVSTMQHLFRQIALESPVVWVNGIGHRPPSLTRTDIRRAWEKLRRMTRPRSGGGPHESGLSGGGAPVAVIDPRVLPWHHVPAVHALNTSVLVREIRRHLKTLGLNRPPALVTGSPPSAGVVGRLGETASVYFCMDDFLNYPGVSAKMIAPLERRLLAHVDALVATAESLTHSKRPASGRTYHLPQGVNFDHFAASRPEPEDLRAIPHPRIGFAGSLSGCCDLPLIRRLAETYSRASIVFVGPITAEAAAVAPIRALPNVHLLGMRPYGDLPAYVQAFDVGIIPYVLNAWTRAVDPLKLLEYLAAGLPVVSTAIPEAAKYSGAVAVAENHDQFIKAVGAALAQDPDGARERGHAVARQHTWRQRADRLLDIIEEIVETGQNLPCIPTPAKAT